MYSLLHVNHIIKSCCLSQLGLLQRPTTDGVAYKQEFISLSSGGCVPVHGNADVDLAGEPREPFLVFGPSVFSVPSI